MSVFAGTNLTVFMGRGPPTLPNGDRNPVATGVLLTNARIGLVKFAGGGYAMDAQGTVELIGVNGVTLSGNAHVRVNTGGAAVDQQIPDSE